MNLLTEKVRPLYLKYLGAAFGSACISSIYGLVDMAMVGQYHGPSGTAAMSVIMPIYNIIYSLGLFMGIGGSVLYSTEKGKGSHRENEFFSTALWGTVILALAVWAAVAAFEVPLLRLFGADDSLLPLCRQYLLPIKTVAPVFVFNQMIAAFLRNDNAPGLAMAGVLCGGIFNVFGDYFFVFTMDMGIYGAGLATAIGSSITLITMLAHFISKSNTLKVTKITRLPMRVRLILTTGFSTFFIDLAMGIITMLFNRQIMHYLGTSALSVYGVIMTISQFAQCCAYSIGQASQPILSINFGAKKYDRIRTALKYALYTSALFGIIWTVLVFVFPTGFIRIFMKPTQEVLQIAPAIMRCYGISFLLLPLNIFSTYYFQSIMRPAVSFIASVGRGLVVSGALIMLLPAAFGANSIWLAMPITEVITAAYVIIMMARYTKKLSNDDFYGTAVS